MYMPSDINAGAKWLYSIFFASTYSKSHLKSLLHRKIVHKPAFDPVINYACVHMLVVVTQWSQKPAKLHTFKKDSEE